MKKSLMVILAAALTGAAWAGDTSADVLVWYLDTDEDMYNTGTEFDTIMFWAMDANNNKVGLAGQTYVGSDNLLAGTPAAGSGDTITVPSDDAPTSIYGTYYTKLSGYESGYSFWMELYSDGQKVERMLTPVTWDDFEDYDIRNDFRTEITAMELETGSRIEKSFKACLSKAEQDILTNRYLSRDSKTLKNLGEEFGKSTESVRRIEKTALRKLIHG